MTSLHVICGLAPPQSKILATRTVVDVLQSKYLLGVESAIFPNPILRKGGGAKIHR